ncbi:MAG: hypothetical protein IAB75_02090 [Bacteroidetes bacterium]|uniref:Uncharacterized protein n=1 Tax=Candidatus Cryptobacteroides avicola TaxID=2840757 RepID=A0A940DRE6_9BACT|nr:hypothetical protein [Candidatus Cryptobacteroides avicola]
MVSPLRKFFRTKALKKYASGIRTGIIPLSLMRDVFILIDSRDQNAATCVALIKEFFHRNGIKPDIFYIDTGTCKGRKKRLDTDPMYTFQKKDLNWYGRLRKNVLQSFLTAGQDLYIDLTIRNDFPVRFIGTAIPAKFKVGCTGKGKNIFDMTITTPSGSEVSSTELFRGISALLMSVK